MRSSKHGLNEFLRLFNLNGGGVSFLQTSKEVCVTSNCLLAPTEIIQSNTFKTTLFSFLLFFEKFFVIILDPEDILIVLGAIERSAKNCFPQG